jgi:hypothetical protein
VRYALLSLVLPALVVSTSAAHADARQRDALRQLRFEPVPSADRPAVRYVARGRAYDVSIEPHAATFVLNGGKLSMRLVGASDSAAGLIATRRLPGVTNYLVGDRTQWRTGVAAYAQVVRENAYPGIDMVFRGDDGALAYDFVVHPGARVSEIKIRFDGATRLRLGHRGDLVLTTSAGDVIHRRPVAYQNVDGARRLVPARYTLGRDRTVAFDVGDYDRGADLVIDPTVVRATYFGGTHPDQSRGYDSIEDLTIDAAGNLYLTGTSSSTLFPIPGAPQPQGEGSLLISKIDPAGNVEFIALFGPLSDFYSSTGAQIEVDDSGAVYVAGWSSHPSFPATPGAASSTGPGFVIKLNATATNLLYAVRLPVEGVSDLAVHSNGEAIVAGTVNGGFPVTNALQPDRPGLLDGYIARITPDGSAFVFATYLGGSGNDQAYGVALDPDGNVYVTGETGSSNFPVNNPLQGYSGSRDGFVAKLLPDGSAFEFSTYLGGSSFDISYSVAVDAARHPVLTGFTLSDDFPTRRPHQPRRYPGEWPDAFVTKLLPDASGLVYSTFFGGESGDWGGEVAIGPDGDAHVVGLTASVEFPSVRATQPVHGDPAPTPFNGGDAFVARFDPAGRPVYATFFGGSSQDSATAIAVDGTGTAHVVGNTQSEDLPLVDPIQPAIARPQDGFLMTIADQPCPRDVTSQLALTPLAPIPLAGGYLRFQVVFVTNTASTGLATPATLTVDGLTPGIALFSTGFTFCPATSGSQYATVHATNSTLAPGQTTLVPLLFLAFDPTLPLTYTSRVLDGVPFR